MERFRNCRGHRPWLATGPESLRGLPGYRAKRRLEPLLSAVESALSIPPWTDKLQETLGTWWASLAAIPDPEHRRLYISLTRDLEQALNSLGMTPEELADAIESRLAQYEEIDTKDLRPAEYRQFVVDQGEKILRDKDFEIRREKVPLGLVQWFSTIVRAVRLREVCALRVSQGSIHPAKLTRWLLFQPILFHGSRRWRSMAKAFFFRSTREGFRHGNVTQR